MQTRDKRIQTMVTLLMGALMALILGLIVIFPSIAQASEEVSILSPLDGASVSGQVEVHVSSPAASGVQLFLSKVGGALINEGSAMRTDGDEWVANWDTQIYENGPYTLTIKALNQVNNALPTATLSVTVDNEVIPAASPETAELIDSEVLEVLPKGESVTPEDAIALELTAVLEEQVSAIVRQQIEALEVDDALSIERISIDKGPGGLGIALTFAGHAAANSTVVLHIFSDPIVVSVETDKRGDWVYTLNAGLSSGEHEVYMTITDNGAKQAARSDVLSFLIPKAYAAPDLSTANVAAVTTTTSSDSSLNLYLLVSIGLIVGAIGTLLAVKLLGNSSHAKDNA